MIALDTNILVYASRRDSPFHLRARNVLADLAEGQSRWAIPWACLHEFFAVVTSGRFYEPPTTPETAITQIAAWLESPTLMLLSEGSTYFQVLSAVLRQNTVRGARIHDAKIAAICVQHGVTELLTADRDFSKFPGLRTRNPLVA